MSKTSRKSDKNKKKKKLLPAKGSTQVTTNPKATSRPVPMKAITSPSRNRGVAAPKPRKWLRYATLGVALLLLLVGALAAFDKTTREYALVGVWNNVKGWFWSPASEGTYPVLEINTSEPPDAKPIGMVWVPGGWFWMGTDDPKHQYASPVHKVYVDGFWMDQYEIANKKFKEFVDNTGYKTIAEQKPIPKYFPGADPEFIRKHPPFSLVFTPPELGLNRKGLKDHMQWWRMAKGADWQHPDGPESNIKDKMNYPVVHISWMDAVEYCNWRSKKEGLKPVYTKIDPSVNPMTAKNEYEADFEANGYRLPTEAEWEFAARGGKHREKYIWGNELQPNGEWLGNIWQGKFPTINTAEDGYVTAAPVGKYPANEFDLYDLAGNVWEWCNDHYQKNHYESCKRDHPDGVKNPHGPLIGHDPLEPGVPKRVQRGGSFLCHASYCERYLTYARGKGEVSSSANHIGFRCVRPHVAVSGK
ncbi:MAG: formylglycine-generating enzyme family protein [Gemmataceae bacterium]